MKVVQITPGMEPVVVDLSAHTMEKRLHNLIHEEVLPIEGTMSLSALDTDQLEPNTLMAELTGDDGYFGTVYICAVWYEELSREQICEVLDWLEEGILPEENDRTTNGYSWEDDEWM